MHSIPYSLQFRGFASAVGPRGLRVRATAPSSSIVTVVAEAGLSGHVGAFGPHEAVLESRFVFLDEATFEERGAITIGRRNVLRFRTLEPGRLEASPDPHLRQAAVVLQIDGGDGQFDRACGRIASILLLSDTFDVTDSHLGLIFVSDRQAEGDSSARARGLEWLT